MTTQHDSIRAIQWLDNKLHLLDQRKLPQHIETIRCDSAAKTAAAISDMVVRGAPAIGVTAAYGVVLSALEHQGLSLSECKSRIENDIEVLARSRPTAVNLFWALKRMRACLTSLASDVAESLLKEAIAIHEEDIAANVQMGKLGASLIEPGSHVITHCNTGSLATGGFGTALGVIRQAWSEGKIAKVYADETRPWLQGSRLTAWELVQDNIEVNLIVEGAAAALMQSKRIQWVIVGSDRISANGDVANKIGTYSLAVNARHHGVRFMVVAPSSTVDMSLASGTEIPIENRSGDELLSCGGTRIAAEGAQAWNPVFDVTPASLVDAIVTEKGIVENPDPAKMHQMMGVK